MTLKRYLKVLEDKNQPLKHSGLVNLSEISEEEIVDVKSVLIAMTKSKKCSMLHRLSTLWEDNLELDFTSVFRMFLDDKNDEIRELAIKGLWECDERTIILPLTNSLKNDPSARVRAASASTLGKFAELAQEGKLLSRDGERIQKALLTAISQNIGSMEVRRRAIESVAHFDSPEVHKLIREAYNDSHSKLKQSSIYAMGRSSDDQWLSIVLQEMHSEDPAIRYEAATACGQLGDESTIPNLTTLIEDEDSLVQAAAIYALGSIGGPKVKQILELCIENGDKTLEEAAQSSLRDVELDDNFLDF